MVNFTPLVRDVNIMAVFASTGAILPLRSRIMLNGGFWVLVRNVCPEYSDGRRAYSPFNVLNVPRVLIILSDSHCGPERVPFRFPLLVCVALR